MQNPFYISTYNTEHLRPSRNTKVEVNRLVFTQRDKALGIGEVKFPFIALKINKDCNIL